MGARTGPKWTGEKSKIFFVHRAISPVFISMGLEIEKSFVNCRFSRVVPSVSKKESHAFKTGKEVKSNV